MHAARGQDEEARRLPVLKGKTTEALEPHLTHLRHLQEHELVPEAAEVDERDAGDMADRTPRGHSRLPPARVRDGARLPYLHLHVPHRPITGAELKSPSGVAIASKSPPTARPAIEAAHAQRSRLPSRSNPSDPYRQSVSPPRLHLSASPCDRWPPALSDFSPDEARQVVLSCLISRRREFSGLTGHNNTGLGRMKWPRKAHGVMVWCHGRRDYGCFPDVPWSSLHVNIHP